MPPRVIRILALLGISLVVALCARDGPVRAAAYPSYDHAWVTGVVEHAHGEVALTFDDCNDAAAWRSIVATLRGVGRHAAFFCQGQNVRAHPTVSRRLVRQGNLLCNHSWSHPDLATLGERRIAQQLRATRAVLYDVAGSRCRYMRPPYGSYNRTVLQVAGRLG